VYSKSVTHSVALSIMKVILDCQGMGLIQEMFFVINCIRDFGIRLLFYEINCSTEMR